MASEPLDPIAAQASAAADGDALGRHRLPSNLVLAREGSFTRLLAWVPLAALVMVAIAVRAIFLGEPQLFRDEATSWYLANHSTGDLLTLVSRETFPPLYVLLLKAWMTVLGDSQGALRSLSVVAGIGTVLVSWRWARDALGDAGGLVAGSLVALCPALVMNSRDARMYSLETFFATSAWWLLWLLLSDGVVWSGRRRFGLALALALAVAGEVWTMSLGVPIAGLQFAFAFVALAGLRSRPAVLATGSVVVGAASLAPWLPNLLSVALNGQGFWTPRPDLGSMAATMRGWLPGDLGSLTAFALILAGACALVGVAALSCGVGTTHLVGEEQPTAVGRWGLRRDRLLALAIAFGFGLMPVVWAYSQFHPIYDPRYLGAAFPPFAIAIASGVVVGARKLRPRLKLAERVPVGLLAILLALPFVAASAVGSARAVDGSRSDAVVEPGRQMAQMLAGLVDPGDVVVTLNAQTYFPLRYYLYQNGQAGRLGIELYDWHKPGAAFYTGWEDIDASSMVDAAQVASLGWGGAVHLMPGQKLWLVTLVSPGREFAAFDPPASGELRVLQTTLVRGGSVTGEIRETVPAAR